MMIETFELLKTLTAVGNGYAGENYAHQARDLILAQIEVVKTKDLEFTRMENSWRTECDRLRHELNEATK